MQSHTYTSIHYIFSPLQVFNIVYQEAFGSFLIGGDGGTESCLWGVEPFPLTISPDCCVFPFEDGTLGPSIAIGSLGTTCSSGYRILTWSTWCLRMQPSASRIWNEIGPIWSNMVPSSHVGTPTILHIHNLQSEMLWLLCVCHVHDSVLPDSLDPLH